MQAQWLYKILLIHPTLSYAGVADWRPGRLAAVAKGMTRDLIEYAAAELQSGRFILVDTETEEVLIRSFLKYDGILKQPRLSVSMVNAFAEIASNPIREVFAFEAQKLHERDPSLRGWQDDRVQVILRSPANPIDVYKDDLGLALGLGLGLGLPIGLPLGLPQTLPIGLPLSTSTSTSTTSNPVDSNTVNTSNLVNREGGSSKKVEPEKQVTKPSTDSARATRLPPNWMPTQESIDLMRQECPNIDLEAEHREFTDYWLSKSGKDATKTKWDLTWRNWIRKAEKFRAESERRSGGKQTQLDGMSAALDFAQKLSTQNRQPGLTLIESERKELNP